MRRLADYSIETDQTVLLYFRDGHKLRIPIAKARHYLAPEDFQTIAAAARLRRDFLRRHMPKVLVMLVAVILLAAFISANRLVAWVWGHSSGSPNDPGSIRIVRSTISPTLTITDKPIPGNSWLRLYTPLAASTSKPQANTAPGKLTDTTSVASQLPQFTTPLPAPSAATSITPIPTPPDPTPEPTPTPSVSPAATPTPEPQSTPSTSPVPNL